MSVSTASPAMYKAALQKLAEAQGTPPAQLKLADALKSPAFAGCPPKLLADLRMQLVAEAKRPLSARSPLFVAGQGFVAATSLPGPLTETVKRGDGIRATIRGEKVTGVVHGFDFRGRPVIAQRGGGRRTADWADCEMLAPQQQAQTQDIVGIDASTTTAPAPALARALLAALDTEVCGSHTAREYVDALTARGYSVLLVGGALRDAVRMLEEDPTVSAAAIVATLKDIDIVTTAPVPVLRDICAGVAPELSNAGVHSPEIVDQFGVVLAGGPKAGLPNKEGLDLACLRSAGTGERQSVNPDTGDNAVPFVFDHNIEEDAWARDFACNAVYARYDAQKNSFELVDPTGFGLADARAKFLRCNRAFIGKNEMVSLRFFKFRMRGYDSDIDNVAAAKQHAERFFPKLGPKRLANAVLRIVPKDTDSRAKLDAYLSQLRQTMQSDGCEALFDAHIEPIAERMWEKLATRLGIPA